jgi:hypothetical protein
MYWEGRVDLRRFGDQLMMDDPAPSARNLGRIKASARGWLFESCDPILERAIENLLRRTRDRGANRVARFRFRGHWTWIGEPVCRRNWSYLKLIVPAFLPVPTSATVGGVAVHDPEVHGAEERD